MNVDKFGAVVVGGRVGGLEENVATVEGGRVSFDAGRVFEGAEWLVVSRTGVVVDMRG